MDFVLPVQLIHLMDSLSSLISSVQFPLLFSGRSGEEAPERRAALQDQLSGAESDSNQIGAAPH